MRAYREFGVRSFAFDSDEELDKIVQETGGAEDLDLFLRLACPNTHSLIPLEGKFGVSSAEAPALLLRARQIARRLGITFHVGSQAVVPAAFGEAIQQVGQLILDSGVIIDAVDIGGGFPSRYPHSDPPELAASCRRSFVPPTSSRSSIPASCYANPAARWWPKPSR